jgi:Pyruvate/2-oxoacid:ferredoxin oxidoreductase delta subunit
MILFPVKKTIEYGDELLGSRMKLETDKFTGCGICVPLCCGNCIELR